MDRLRTSMWSLLKRAGWAPIAVLIIHRFVLHSSFRKELDFAMHFSGGMAIAYFSFHALHYFEWLLGKPTPFGRYLFAFALACTVGVFWEFGELASDVFLGTHIQKNIHETMGDLIADATGSTLALLLVCAARILLRAKTRNSNVPDPTP